MKKRKSSVSDPESSSDDDNNEAEDDREECKYGAKCFRTNKEHLDKFKHPAKSKAKSKNAAPKKVSKTKNDDTNKKGDSEHDPPKEVNKSKNSGSKPTKKKVAILSSSSDDEPPPKQDNKTKIDATKKKDPPSSDREDENPKKVNKLKNGDNKLAKKKVTPPSHSDEDENVPEANLETAPLDSDTSDTDVDVDAKTKCLPACKFGASCFRKNLLHFSEYSHPIQKKKSQNDKSNLKCKQPVQTSDDDEEKEEETAKTSNGSWTVGKNDEDEEEEDDQDHHSNNSLPLLKRSYSSLTEKERRQLIASAFSEKQKLQKQLEQKSKEAEEKDAELKKVKKQLYSGGIGLLEGEAEALKKDELTYFELKAKRTNENTPAELHFRLAESQFYRLMPANTNCSITKIDYVVSPKLVSDFNEAKKNLAATRGEDMSKPVLAFHGTAEANILPICETGFKIPGQDGHKHATDTGWYGKGVYFSEFPNYSMGYIKGGQKLLLCQVLPGKVYKCPGLIHGQALQGGHDCHMSPCGKELVIFKKEHILPSYIVYYTHTTTEFKYDDPQSPSAKVVSKPSTDDLSAVFKKVSKEGKSGCLSGCKFVLCGKLISHHTTVTTLITNHGGTTSEKVEPSTTALLTSDEPDKQSSKVAYASKLNIPVVSERYLYDCVSQKKLLANDLYKPAKKAFAVPGGVLFASTGVMGGFGTGFAGGSFSFGGPH